MGILLSISHRGTPPNTSCSCPCLRKDSASTDAAAPWLVRSRSQPFLQGGPRGWAFTDKKVKSLSRVRLFVTPWTVACWAPLSMRFHRQEYWSGLPFLTPGDLPDPGIKPTSLASPALAGRLFTIELPEMSHRAQCWWGPDWRWQRKVLKKHNLVYDNQEPWLTSKSSPQISHTLPYSSIF